MHQCGHSSPGGQHSDDGPDLCAGALGGPKPDTYSCSNSGAHPFAESDGHARTGPDTAAGGPTGGDF